MKRTHSLEGIEVTAQAEGTDVVLDAVIGDDTILHPRSALIMARSLPVGALTIAAGKLRVRAQLHASSVEREREVARYLARVVTAVRSTLPSAPPGGAAVACLAFWCS